MMHIHHWGAVLAMLCLASLGTETAPLQDSNPELRIMFLVHSSNGKCLSRDELQGLLLSEFKQIQGLNEELLDKLMMISDDDQDGGLDMDEFTKLVTFITRDRPH